MADGRRAIVVGRPIWELNLRERTQLRRLFIRTYQEDIEPYIVTIAPRALRRRRQRERERRRREPEIGRRRRPRERGRDVRIVPCDDAEECTVLLRGRHWPLNFEGYPMVEVGPYFLPIYVIVYIVVVRDGWPLGRSRFVWISHSCPRNCVDTSHMGIFSRNRGP